MALEPMEKVVPSVFARSTVWNLTEEEETMEEKRKAVTRRVTKVFFLMPLSIVLFAAVAIFLGGGIRPALSEETPTEIRIGDTVSHTGPYAVFGGVSSFGTNAAIEDINKQGGIFVKKYGKKLPVKWITRDCQSDPLKVAPLTEDLILRDKVHFLGGHFEVPAVRQGTAMMAEKYKIPAVFGIGPYEPWVGMREAVTPQWKYSWAFGFSIATPALKGDFRDGKPGYLMMPAWFGALDSYGAKTNKKAAVFAFDDPDGRGWYMGFTGAAAEKGYDCYRAKDQFGIYPPGTTDFTPLIQEWKKHGCEILWGNSIAPDLGIMLKQCKTQGFRPKLVFATRGAMFYQEIVSWGGDLPNGVLTETYWTPSIKGATGIGGTTPQSLAQRWYEAKKEPLAQGIGWNYAVSQTLFDAIERAGTLDPQAVLKALAETDMNTMWGRVVFEKGTQFNRIPCQIGQWVKTKNPWVWEMPITFSYNDFMPAQGKLLYPKPWD
jgi:ABC-type branched-subunit amino acid transport system substrate-binding protein